MTPRLPCQLSKNQQLIFAAIAHTIHQQGMPPTIREISHLTALRNPSQIDYHLNHLERYGVITRVPKCRGIHLTDLVRSLPVLGQLHNQHLKLLLHPSVLDRFPFPYAINVEGSIWQSDHICHGDYLLISGSYQPGDLLLITQEQDDTQIAFLKRWNLQEQVAALHPAHPDNIAPPLMLQREYWEHAWRVIGKVVALHRFVSCPPLSASGPGEQTGRGAH
ncbi:hypothetical protein KSF_108780 [Reticulibacter mediterranei]|uniref:LexA repressor DNA-binding domain-containing protein n=1 Tax=Reticulibacter mediterranei TaxID=2778369 RepID=A0A8J3J1Z2_9CHLR|nr:hypothetical protein [Reticulibacter mediterranei]GHP00831.1 hypothetical protein KSF_108780 [Reticulibacter mediterranei]